MMLNKNVWSPLLGETAHRSPLLGETAHRSPLLSGTALFSRLKPRFL